MNNTFTDQDFAINLYERLEIESDATATEIARAYKKRAMETHPDRNPDNPQATAEFVAVGRAYEVLKEPQLRRQYDAEIERRAGRTATHTSSSTARTADQHTNFEDPIDWAWRRAREADRPAPHFHAASAYVNFKYTPEDLQRYMDAANRMNSGQYQSGDLGTVFNFLAGSGGEPRNEQLTGPDSTGTLPTPPLALPGRKNGGS